MWRSALRVGRHTGRSGERDDSGMVTAEMAAAMPALVLVASLLLTVVGMAADSSRASDAARSAARAASIGTDEATVVDAARALAPQGSRVEVTTHDGWVHVEVSVQGRRFGPLQLPDVAVTGAAPLEPGQVP